MGIQELFVMSNCELRKVIDQITTEAWDTELAPGTASKPTKLKDAVQYHTYDDAWVPDVLAGKTKADVGDKYEYILQNEDVIATYDHCNDLANAAVSEFTDLERTVHLSYGDYPAREYLQHIISFRAFRSYDLAKLLGLDTTMRDEFVQALHEEFSPVIGGYRQMGVFPPALKVDNDASPQTKLLAMVGRD